MPFRISATLAALLLLACSDAGPGNVNGVVQRIDVTPAEVILQPGQTQPLTARVYDSTNQLLPGTAVTWQSTNASVASVSGTGVVSGVAVGEAKIRASAGGRSGEATVVVTATVPTGQVIDVVPGITYQTMTGWEGTTQIGELECNRQAFGVYRPPLIQRLVNELGINRVRLPLRSGTENPTDWFAQHITGQLTRPQWRVHWYEIVNDNADPRSINPAGFKFSFLDYTIDSVITPLRQALAARGEQLYVNLNYTDFDDSPLEHSSNAEEFAELLVATFQHIQAKYGWVPDAVEMILEPDNTSNWRVATIGPALVAAGDRLKAAGFTPAFIAPSHTGINGALVWFNALVAMPRVMEYLTDLSYHRYSSGSTADLSQLGARAAQLGVRTQMLEYLDSGLDILHEDLTVGRNSAWQKYSLAYCAENSGSYYKIDQSNPAAPTIELRASSRYFPQYFQRVRMNAVRIGALTGDTRFDPVAFRNTNGKLVVVVKAAVGGGFQVRNLAAGTYGITYTTASAFNVSLPDVNVSAGQALSTSIPAAGVLTIFRR
jgi:hypothetical protein